MGFAQNKATLQKRGALDHGTTTKPTPRPRRPPPPDEGAVAGPPPPQTAAPFAQLGAVSVGLRHGGGADDRPHPLAAAPGGGPAGGQPTVRGPRSEERRVGKERGARRGRRQARESRKREEQGGGV